MGNIIIGIITYVEGSVSVIVKFVKLNMYNIDIAISTANNIKLIILLDFKYSTFFVLSRYRRHQVSAVTLVFTGHYLFSHMYIKVFMVKNLYGKKQ